MAFRLGVLAAGLGFSAPSQGVILVHHVFNQLGEASLFGKAAPYPHPQKKVRRLAAKAEETEKKARLHYDILRAAYSMDLEQMANVLNSGQSLFVLNGVFYSAPPGAAAGDQPFWLSGPLPAEAGEKGVLPEDLKKLQINPAARKIIRFIERRRLSPPQAAIVLLLFLRDKSLTDSEALALIDPVMLRFGISPGEPLRAGDLALMFPPGFFEAGAGSSLKPSGLIASFSHFAALSGRKNLFARLLSRGDFDPNLRDAAGRSPLHSLFLIKANTEGWTSKDWEETVSAIQEHPNSDLNLQDIHGLTPIAMAAVNGHYHAVRLLSEAPGADLQARDSYGRTLAIIAAGSSEPNRKEMAGLMLRKGGSGLAAISGLNEYLTEDFELVTLSVSHPLESAIFQAIVFLSGKENADPNGIARLKASQDLLKKALDARESIAAGLDSAAEHGMAAGAAAGPGGEPWDPLLLERSALQKAIEENNLSFIENHQRRLKESSPEGRNILFEPLSSLILRRDEFRRSVWISALRARHFLLSAIEMNQPDMVSFFLERMGPAAGYVFRPHSGNVPELPLEEAKSLFSALSFGKDAFDKLTEKIPEYIVFMDPLSEALLVSAGLRSELHIENRELEQQNSRKILSALINHKNSDLLFKSFLGLTPMETAILTGHLDVVVELREKDVPLPAAAGGLFGSGAPLKEVARGLGFKKMARYLDEEGQGLPPESGCRDSFLH